MEFQQQVLATLAGVMGGFVFSIILFYLTEQWRDRSEKKTILQNVIRECDYNIMLLQRMREQLNDMLQEVAVSKAHIYKPFVFNRIQRLFMQEAFKKGFLYEILESDHIIMVDEMLRYYDAGTDSFARDVLKDLETKKITADKALEHFNYDKIKIREHLDFLRKVKAILEKEVGKRSPKKTT